MPAPIPILERNASEKFFIVKLKNVETANSLTTVTLEGFERMDSIVAGKYQKGNLILVQWIMNKTILILNILVID
jgi:hypothetical protein